MSFTPAISTTQTEGLLFVVKGLALCVARGTPMRVPVGPAGAEAICIGALDGKACFARGLAAGGVGAIYRGRQ